MLGGRLTRRTIVVALVAGAFILLAPANPASAHAQLEWTTPVSSSVLTTEPGKVVLHFGEDVSVDPGSVRVLGPAGGRVDEGDTHTLSGDGHSVAVDIDSNAGRGTYVVSWRVISADSHPVHGAFVFFVGTASGSSKAAALVARLSAQSGSAPVGAIYGVLRFLVFASLALVVGISLIVYFVWSAGRTHRVTRVLTVAWVTLVASSIVEIGIQGVYGAGLPLTDMARWELWNQVLHSRFGEVDIARIALLAAMVPAAVVTAGRDRPPRRWSQIYVGALCAALVFTPGISGHAGVGADPILGLVSDFVHVGSVSLWFGGLAVLLCLLVPGAVHEDGDALAPDLVDTGARRISTCAFWAVVLIIATGTAQSIRQVGSFYAFFHTPYGVTLAVKIGLVVLVVCAGAVSRRVLHGRSWLRLRHREAEAGPQGSPAPPLRRLRRSVTVEVVLVCAVLAVTSVLVNENPARQAARQPFTRDFPVDGVHVNVIIAPARVGAGNQFHAYVLGSLGQPVGIAELDVSINLPSESLGPFAIPVVLAGPGHYVASTVDVPVAGNWQLRMKVRTSDIDEQVVYATFPVH